MLTRETDEIALDDDRRLILALNFSLGDKRQRIMASIIAKLKNKSRRAVKNKTKTNATLVSQSWSDAAPSNYRAFHLSGVVYGWKMASDDNWQKKKTDWVVRRWSGGGHSVETGLKHTCPSIHNEYRSVLYRFSRRLMTNIDIDTCTTLGLL